jgi:hypothetical protein
MWTAITIIAALALLVGFLWWRWTSRLRRGVSAVDAAWRDVERALADRRSEVENFLAALTAAGYVAEARTRLAEALAELARAQLDGPRALANADERLKIALRAAFSGLPRERVPEVREAQNHLAEVEDELDLVRHRYNELVLDWNSLLRVFPYRYLSRWLKFSAREPYLLPSQDAEFIRRHAPPL